MAVKLLIFDLDDTLIRTADLEQRFRGQQFLGRQSQQYVDDLRAAYSQNPGRVIYSGFTMVILRAKYPGVRIGVFTRSPRHYAEVLLERAYPGLLLDFLIAFEDTPQPKPSGEGIRGAMARFNVPDPWDVWMVGDSPVDIRAAYDAGCHVVLDTTTWPRTPAPRRRDDWKALERMPDAIIDNAADLMTTLDSHLSFLPVAERLQQTACAPIPNRRPFARLEKFGAFDHEGVKHDIHYLGRHFSTQAQNRATWHQVTNDIHTMKNALVVPDYWVEAIGAFLQNLVRRNPHLSFGNSLVVTVVPAKPGRTRRLEAMLAQLSTVHAQRRLVSAGVSFTPDLMRYREGVLSHHGEGLNKQQRIENVMNHLEVIPESGYENKHVVVIDDVATTGASLIYARKYLIAAGARQVTCLSLTKAINTQ